MDIDENDRTPQCLDCSSDAEQIDEYWYGSYCSDCRVKRTAPKHTCDTLEYPKAGIPSRCGAQAVVSIKPKGMDIPTRYCVDHVHLAPEVDQALVSPYDY